jgi:ATP-binding cassette subfamily C protein CydC
VISPARIVLLDEPTEHLDVTDGEQVLDALLDPNSELMSQQRTVVVATHHLPKGLDCRQLNVER